MPQTLTTTELRPRLAEALRSAESGRPVLITRHGRPTAALVAVDQLDGPSIPSKDPTQSEAEEPQAKASTANADANPGATEASPEALLQQAATLSLRRIDLDLSRLPESLQPVLGLIRENLFQPGLTVERIRQTLGLGGHDVTTHFRDAAGTTIRNYLEDRRLECAGRLLIDTSLEVPKIAQLVGYRRTQAFHRAFQRRYGTRPRIYRQFSGRLSQEAANTAATGRAPIVPQYLAGLAKLAPDACCAGCDVPLEPDATFRIFEDLAPICDGCAQVRAPELHAALADAVSTQV